jgi:hypothetical protein
MGNAQSQTTTIVNDVCMSVTSEFVSTNIVSASASSVNAQTLTLNIGIADGCPIDVNQSIKSSVTVKASIDTTATRQLAATLESKLDTALEQSTAMVNDIASTTGGNTQDTNANIRNTIKQSIETRVTNTNIMQIVADSFNTNTGVMNLAVCRNSPIKWSQSIVSDVIAQNILTQITQDIVDSTVIQAAVTAASQDTSMENKGLSSMIDSFFTGVAGVFGVGADVAKTYIIACVALLCLCCAGLVAFALSPAGQEASAKAVNAGINMAKQHGGGGGMKGPSGGGSPFM